LTGGPLPEDKASLGIGLPSTGEARALHHSLPHSLTLSLTHTPARSSLDVDHVLIAGAKSHFIRSDGAPASSPAHTPRSHVHAGRRVTVQQSTRRRLRLSCRIFLPNCVRYECAPSSLPSIFLVLYYVTPGSHLNAGRRVTKIYRGDGLGRYLLSFVLLSSSLNARFVPGFS